MYSIIPIPIAYPDADADAGMMVMMMIVVVGIVVVGRGGDMGKEKGRIRIHQMQAGIGAIRKGMGVEARMHF